MEEGDFISQGANTTFNLIPPVINNTLGNIIFQDFRLDSGISGDGSVAVITFKAKSAGISNLTLEDAFIFNSTGDPMPDVTTRNGTVYVNPSPVANISSYEETTCDTYPIPPNTVYEDNDVTFDGSNSYDPDGTGARDNRTAGEAAIYVADTFGNLELVYRDKTMSAMFPMPIRPRRMPPAFPLLMAKPEAKHGVLYVQTDDTVSLD